jgi:hypothetical protein
MTGPNISPKIENTKFRRLSAVTHKDIIDHLLGEGDAPSSARINLPQFVRVGIQQRLLQQLDHIVRIFLCHL